MLTLQSKNAVFTVVFPILALIQINVQMNSNFQPFSENIRDVDIKVK